jgi:hypothetical protein
MENIVPPGLMSSAGTHETFQFSIQFIGDDTRADEKNTFFTRSLAEISQASRAQGAKALLLWNRFVKMAIIELEIGVKGTTECLS